MEFNVKLMVKEVWYSGAWSCHAHFHSKLKFLDETLIIYHVHVHVYIFNVYLKEYSKE